MRKTALDAFLERYRENGGYLSWGEFCFGDYRFQYSGTYFGYVWEKGEDGLSDPDTEHKYGWDSFEEFLTTQ